MSTNLPSFEKAEYAAQPGVATSWEKCVRCQQSPMGRFFRLNGQLMCEPCANAAVSTPAHGTEAAFAQAIAIGLGAAVAGSILYAVVEIITGWTIGYVALAVGWLVGKGMRWGSAGRGGRRYQIAAAVLTYLSVSFASLIVILHAAQKRNPGSHLILDERFAFFATKYGLLSPFLSLQDGLGGIIGLFILFIGVRAAWTLMAGSEYAITGPFTVPHDAGVQIP
jgi:hypothetical protein